MPRAEKALIAQIKRIAGKPGRAVLRGIGDDCAVLRPPAGHELVITTDLMLEGTHFRRDWHPPDSVGYKCLARGLSDIAAMGATPMAAFLSLGLPQDVRQSGIDGFFQGFMRLANQHRVTLAGGDIAESQRGIVADIMVVGSVPRGKAVLRSGARPDDIIYVTGALGQSAAILTQLRKRGKKAAKDDPTSRHFYPEPRVELGRYLRERNLATSMIDLSDGLSTDLDHICKESKCGASIVRDLVPMATGVGSRIALDGGEDYELLFTANPSARVPIEIAGVPVTEIGWIAKEKGMRLIEGTRTRKLLARGWEHFRKSSR
jgi:thiamine-monophosphate kinase